MNPALPVTVLLAASVLWGTAWLPLKALSELGIDGIPLVTMAYGAATLALLPLLIGQRRQWHGEGHWLLLIVLIGGYANLAFSSALIYGQVVRVMVLFYLLPVWGVLGGRLFLGEHIDNARWLAVVLALAGAVLVLGGDHALDGGISWIDLLALSAGFAFAMNNILFRARQRIPVPSKISAMLAGCALIGALLLSAGAQPLPDVPFQSWLWVVLFGLAWLLAATAGSQWGVTHLEAGRASIIIVMELVSAVVSATLVGGENLQPSEWLGGALILTAATIEARRPAEAQPVPAA